MRRRGSISAVLLVAYLAGLTGGQVARLQRVQILETGDSFHHNDVKARSGEMWLGLYVTRDGFELRESKVTIRPAKDEIADVGTNLMTGKSVSVNDPRKPVFLVKGADMLKPGPVMTSFLPKQLFSLGEHRDVTLKLGEQSYRLYVTGSRPSENGSVLPVDAALYLSAGRTKQRLYSFQGDQDDASWWLLWAGDLDGDGKLDLYADLGYHYGLSERRLFLSSQAWPGRLVAEVGKFVTSGC